MSDASLDQRYASAKALLEPIGQAHVLTFYEDLDEQQKARLLEDIDEVDWPEVARLVETHVRQQPMWRMPEQVEPAPYYPNVPPKNLKAKYKEARRVGEQLLRKGKVAAFTVAGGQGTRLGWEGPKGTFPATAIRKLPLFACYAEYIRKAQQKYETVVPWYIMTSPLNHQDTLAFFEEHGYFGLEPSNVMLFPQAMMPAFDMHSAKALLAQRDSLALSPNGHGGSLKALYTSGAVNDMLERGIEQISYTQVDNPLVKVVDPLFLGLHALDECEMSSKMLPKAYPKEKLGVFCVVNGRVTVIEYSNLPDTLAEQRTETGELSFRAGSIAIHVIRADFVKSLNESAEGFRLPWNRAEKKVAYLDPETGKQVEPDEPNAVKLETFVFDALPLCEHSIIYETSRVEEFAPIKNADAEGAMDTPATSVQGQTERAARWLEANGVKVPRNAQGQVDAVIEISHVTAIEASDLQAVDLPDSVEPGTQVLL